MVEEGEEEGEKGEKGDEDGIGVDWRVVASIFLGLTGSGREELNGLI